MVKKEVDNQKEKEVNLSAAAVGACGRANSIVCNRIKHETKNHEEMED